MKQEQFSGLVPYPALEKINSCRFSNPKAVEDLRFRETPYWHSLLVGRHLGVHRPDDRICNWTARLLTKDKRYVQRCLGPALDTGRGAPLSFVDAIERAFEWFATPDAIEIGHRARPATRTSRINICPLGDVYTVGHALAEYSEWSKIARSPGTNYNNIVLINYHIIPHFASIPLEEFSAEHLARLAQQVLETPPRYGFMAYPDRVSFHDLSSEELRKRKARFNSLVSILRMAFRHAWDNARIESERPWRCLRRISVNHAPRTLFLNRDECRRLLKECTPALRKLVLAGLYTGCRVGELGNLRVEDVASEIYGIRIAAFKRSPARFIFLPDEGMAFFLSCCEGKQPRDHVFLSDMGKVWKKQHTALFRRAVANARLPSEFVFHGLRHTYASDLIRQGVQMDVVAKQLGHADTTTVANTYGHLAEHFREAQIRHGFSPLDEEQELNAQDRKCQLEALWASFQSRDWRSYGALENPSSGPRKSYSSTHRAVLEVFDQAGTVSWSPRRRHGRWLVR
jgi:integrase